ncbi:MAG: nitroreductase family protein, partial [Deltaproteobacteria bacterium]
CPPVEKEQVVGPEQLEHFLRARRSIRAYKEKPVEREKLVKLIDIARFAPTGSNKQTPEWRVVESPGKVQVLSDMVIDWMQSVIKKKPDMAAELDLQELVDIRDSGYDIICRKAPHAIVVHAPKQTGTPTEDGIIAMTYLELAAFSFGLGACWAGYLNFAINKWPPLRKVLSIPENHISVGAILLGYPRFKYHRLPLRNDPKIAWL